MKPFDENNLNDQNESLRDTNYSGKTENTGSSVLEAQNPYTEAENPAGNTNIRSSTEDDLNRSAAYGENAGISDTNRINSDVGPGPGDDDDDDDFDDDDDLLDDDGDTLIPIEGDEEDEDSLLNADEDEDVIPGTDMDDGDLLDEDDDYDDEDTPISRTTIGDMGSDVSRRHEERRTGRMIDHEPGASEI